MGRIAIVDGIRTPFCKAGTLLKDLTAYDLGRIVVRELLERISFDPELVDEVIIGNVAQPPEAANIARVIQLRAGLPLKKPAYTVHRNCASGMEAITSAGEKIRSGYCEIVIAGGVESMSNIPFMLKKSLAEILMKYRNTKGLLERIKVISEIRPAHLQPVPGIMLGLTDIVCGLNMGQTAEVLAKEFGITRKEQDEFALLSHRKAIAARVKLKEEIVPIIAPPKYKIWAENDNGPREDTSLDALAKLKPYFDRLTGTVTVGNSCQVTDGACAVLVMDEEKAKALGYQPLGFLRSYAYVGLEPHKMGLGPAFAIPEALKKSGVSFKEIQLIEINEAFAAQVIACERTLAKSTGELNRDITNVNGGAIALGHPVGTTGARLVLTLLKEMKRRNLNLGLATLCVGGGQGAALILER